MTTVKTYARRAPSIKSKSTNLKVGPRLREQLQKEMNTLANEWKIATPSRQQQIIKYIYDLHELIANAEEKS